LDALSEQFSPLRLLFRSISHRLCYGVRMRVANEIRRRLGPLRPTRLELIDESARHAGHAGARPQGGSHFRLLIVADAFSGRGRVERQRMVYAALGDLMRTDVHALSITALAPAEDR
jgi:BolA family transcriptional regulator, general stress-responsive regulator